MGIRVKNLDHVVIPLRAPGTLTAAQNKDAAMIPVTGKIINIYAKQLTAGGGDTSTIADIHLNGTTIFADSTKITTTATTGVVSYSDLDSQPTNVTAGDILTLDVDQIGTSGANLCVLVTVGRHSGVKTETHEDDHADVI